MLDRSGSVADIVLGFGSLESYVTSHAYHGAVCGRFGNRIKDAKFALDGTEWNIARNDGTNHLHGGFVGFDQKNWAGVGDQRMNAVSFHAVSPNGEEGFPGTLTALVAYALSDDNVLSIDFRAMTDRKRS